MPHVNDCKVAYFESVLLHSGQLNDLMLEWLQAQPGVTATQLNDAWNQYFDTVAIPAGQFNDRYVAWLKSKTAIGETLNDLQYDYYCNVVVVPPVPVNGLLVGGSPVDETIATWAAITDGSFNISVDAASEDIVGADFSLVATMADVEEAIQIAIWNAVNSDIAAIEVAYEGTNLQAFDMNVGTPGQEISFTSDAASGTPISTLMLTCSTCGGSLEPYP